MRNIFIVLKVQPKHKTKERSELINFGVVLLSAPKKVSERKLGDFFYAGTLSRQVTGNRTRNLLNQRENEVRNIFIVLKVQPKQEEQWACEQSHTLFVKFM
ncbi:MAG: hypothetical protein IJW24_04405 [Clostridia bacterium]|nr:hypothetical protein [Clostridia bacterium]